MQNPLFIPVVLAALSLNSVIANAADKQTATIVHGGTVHFVGELVNAACAVTTESSNLTVALGQHHIARLNQAGDKTTPVKFQIKLEDCDNTLATSAAIAFYGQTSNIDISSVQNIEVLRGPFSALYGNASGGVMNVSLKRVMNRQPLKPAVITAVTEHGVTV